MKKNESGNVALMAIPILLGVVLMIAGALTVSANLGYGLILIGLGIICAGFAGSLTFGGLGIRVSGALGGVILVIGAVISYLPRP
jgi:hypothetical protein